MAILSLLVAVFFFLIGALSSLFNWDLGDIDPLFWGLFFFALSHFLTSGFADFGRR